MVDRWKFHKKILNKLYLILSKKPLGLMWVSSFKAAEDYLVKTQVGMTDITSMLIPANFKWLKIKKYEKV